MLVKMRLITSVLGILFLIGQVFAQDAETHTFISQDGGFSFDYPIDWTVDPTNMTFQFIVRNLSESRTFFLPEGFSVLIQGPLKSYNLPYIGETPRDMVMQEVNSTAWTTSDILIPSAEGTLQPLDAAQAGDFLIDGRPAAYAYSVVQTDTLDASELIIIVDLGDDYWVRLSASSRQGGLKTLEQNKVAILNMAQSMRYTPPPPVYSGNPDLPRVYSGLVGIMGRGNLEFDYPENWIASNTGNVMLSNKEGRLQGATPVSGQLIATVNGVSETRLAVSQLEIFNNCSFPNMSLTARKLADQMLDQILEHLEELTQEGISITQPETITINGIEIVYFRQYAPDFEALYIYPDLGDGSIPLTVATSMRGEMAYFEDQLFQVVGTFRYTPIIPETCINAPSTP